MIETMGMILLWTGLVIFFIGIICFNWCKAFDGKLLVTSIMDACGLLTFMIGAMLCFGLSTNTLKVLLILIAVLVIGPLSSHEIARLSRKRHEKGDDL